MNKNRLYFKVMMVLVVCLVPGCLFAAPAGKIYVASGDIKAIELKFNTVVIEAPMGKHMFTVGGPLAPDAILTKGGKKAALEDFSPGDRVSVKWKTTERGHLILKMKSK
jgi:hypothetical protein